MDGIPLRSVELQVAGGGGRNDPDAVQHAQARAQGGRGIALLEEDEQVVVVDLAAFEVVHPLILIGDLDQVFARGVHGVDRTGGRGGAPGDFVEQLVIEVDVGWVEVDAGGIGHQLIPQGRRGLGIGGGAGRLFGCLAHGGGKAVQVVGLDH